MLPCKKSHGYLIKIIIKKSLIFNLQNFGSEQHKNWKLIKELII